MRQAHVPDGSRRCRRSDFETPSRRNAKTTGPGPDVVGATTTCVERALFIGRGPIRTDSPLRVVRTSRHRPADPSMSQRPIRLRPPGDPKRRALVAAGVPERSGMDAPAEPQLRACESRSSTGTATSEGSETKSGTSLQCPIFPAWMPCEPGSAWRSTVALITPRELARRLNLSVSTLAKWRCYGCGPAYRKIGNRIRYDEDDVAVWLRARVRRSTSDIETPAVATPRRDRR